MKNKKVFLTVVVLTVTIGNYMIVSSTGNTRMVEKLSGFVMGVLTGILILQVAQILKERKNNSNK